MNYIKKFFRGIKLILDTAFIKLKYGRAIIVHGFIRKKKTQIYISDIARMEICDLVYFSYGCYISAVAEGEFKIGEKTFFNRNCIAVCRDNINIGENVYFGPGVTIYDHDHVFTADKGVAQGFKTGSIVIENNCWIGANVIILRNTHIGEGVIIGAGTVIKGDIPAHSLVKGTRDVCITPLH